MSWCWLGAFDARPVNCARTAAVRHADGGPAGYLAVWPSEAKPEGHVARVDARSVDGSGPEWWISLSLAPPGVSLPFDDPAVSGALRAALAMPRPPEVMSTLLLDSSRYAGALVGGLSSPQRNDPFARIFPARRLHVEQGLLGRVLMPVGPGIARHGSGNPWPGTGF